LFFYTLINACSSTIGTCGLEPQTSTVSIFWAIWEQMRWSEGKWHGEN